MAIAILIAMYVLFTEAKNNKDSSANDYQTTVTVDNVVFDQTKTVITSSSKVNN